MMIDGFELKVGALVEQHSPWFVEAWKEIHDDFGDGYCFYRYVKSNERFVLLKVTKEPLYGSEDELETGMAFFNVLSENGETFWFRSHLKFIESVTQ